MKNLIKNYDLMVKEEEFCCKNCDKCEKFNCVDPSFQEEFNYDPCKEGECDSDRYAVRENVAAGEVEVVSTCPEWYRTSEGGFSEVFSGTEAECQEYIEDRVKSSRVWAVFVNRPAGEVYYSEEHCFSGNWRGNRDNPFSCREEFASEEEAKASVEKWKEYFNRC